MGNLGWYQVMVVAAKRVGGPLQLGALILGGGAALGAAGLKAVQTVKEGFSNVVSDKEKEAQEAPIFTVNMDGTDTKGLVFKAGEKFKVLENDGDAVLIERIGDKNNPYFVSAKFLKIISDFQI